MPIYTVEGPDKRTYDIEGPEGATLEQLVAVIQQQGPAFIAQQPKPSTLMGELRRGAEQLISSTRTGLGGMFGSPEEAAAAGIERGREISERAGEGPSFERLQRVYQEQGVLPAAKQAVSDLPQALAGQGANIAAVLAGGKLGAMAGSAVAPGIGTIAGGVLGSAAAVAPQLFGTNIERQVAEQRERGETPKVDVANAALATAAQTGLEIGGTAAVFGKSVIKGVLGIADDAALAASKNKDTLLKMAQSTIKGGVARGAAIEMPVELSQSIIERAQAGLDLTSPDAMKEYGEALYLAGLVGGPLGGAGRVMDRSSARRALAAEQPPTPEAAPALPPEAPTEPGAQGELFPTAAPAVEPATPTREEDTERLRSLREEFDRLQRENERLRAAPEADQATARAEAEKLAPQLESLQAEIKEVSKRLPPEDIKRPGPVPVTPVEGQYELAFDDRIRTQDLPNYGIPAIGGTPAQIGVRGWMQDNVVGKTVPQIERLVKQQPELVRGEGLRARALREMITPQPAAFKEPVREPRPETPSPVAEQPELDFGGAEPSVAGPVEPQRRPRRVRATEQPAASERLGLEPAGAVAEPGDVVAQEQPAALIEPTPTPVAEAWEEFKPDGAPAFDALSPSMQADWQARYTERPERLTMQDADEVLAAAPVEAPARFVEPTDIEKYEKPNAVLDFGGYRFSFVSLGGVPEVLVKYKDGRDGKVVRNDGDKRNGVLYENSPEWAQVEVPPTLQAALTQYSKSRNDAELQAAEKAVEDAVNDINKQTKAEQTKPRKERRAKKQAKPTPAPAAESTKEQTLDETKAIETTVKQAIEDKLNDFLVGDQVRFGNTPGVVIGLEGDYVRFRPDSARSPKAYQRVPKTSLTMVARPDTTSEVSYSKEQDNKFGEEAGQLNANKGNLIQLLGSNMYAANLADVAVKELLQNAFDAVKGAVSSLKAPALYKTGSIEISIDSDTRTISIKDNARGMTPEIVREAFFTIAGSEKSDLPPSERSGGLGLAKMGFMLGSERIQLDTVRDGVRVTVDATAQDIANDNFKIVKSPAPKTDHGTTVTVKIPENYIEQTTGDPKPIWFPYSLRSIGPLNKPLIGPVSVDLVFDGEKQTLPVGENFPADKYQSFKANFDWGSADIYFGIERKTKSYATNHQVLSSGVYQFDDRFQLNNEKIPYDIIVNVKPNVGARHPDYPFENSRERFKGRLKNDIDSLTAYLGQIARGYEAAGLQESFKGIVSMPRVEAGADIAGMADKLKKSFGTQGAQAPAELKPLPKEVTITPTDVRDTRTQQVLVDTQKAAEKEKESTFKGEKVKTATDFMIDMKQDPKLPIFHNNTNVDFLELGREYGEPEKFFAELGTLMVEMKEDLAKSGIYGYEKLSPDNLFFAGVSIDKDYGGVHIKVPYKAVLVNPFYDWGARTLFGVRQNLLNTMIHEIAHTGSMDHGVAHNGQMIKVEQYLADEGLVDYYRDAILDLLRRHESTFTAMRDAYGRSTTKNTAKSLEDVQKDTAAASARGDRGRSEDEIRAVSAGEGRRRGKGVRATAASRAEGEVSQGPRGVSAVTPTEQDMQAGFSPQPGGTARQIQDITIDRITKFRRMMTDAGATVFNEIAKNFNNAVTTALKDPRVEAVYRQAEASDQLVPAVYRLGVVRRDKGTNLWKAAKASGVKSVQDITEELTQWGETQGLKFEASWNRADELLRAAREHEFRRLNKTQEKGRDFPVSMSDADIDRLYAEYQQDKKLQAIKDDMDKLRFDFIDQLVAVGRITKEMGADWKAATAYVPFDRVEEMDSKFRQKRSVGRGIAQLGQLPELVNKPGTNRPPKNVLENYIGLIGWMTQEVVRQDATLRTLRALEDIGQAQFRTTPPPESDRKVATYVNGEERYFVVASPYHVAAFRSDITPLPGMFTLMGQFSRALRTAITAIPTFTATQLPQDIQRAIMASGVRDPVALTAKTLGNFKDFAKAAALGKLSDVAPELSEFGVVGGVDFHKSNPAESFLQDIGKRNRTLLKSSKFGELLNRLNGVALASDIAVRKAIYDQTIEETQGDRQLALERAREIINFRRFGAGDPLGILHVATQTIPFFNAYLQGTDVLYRSLTGKEAPSGLKRNAALKLYWTNVGYLMAASTLYAMLMAGDEEYENMDLRERDRTWVIGGGLGIPVPAEIGILFKSIPERVLEVYRKHGTPEEAVATEALLGWFRAAYEEYLGRQVPIPAAAKPLLENFTNYSFLTGRPLEGIFQQGQLPSERVTTRTSELAKQVAQFTAATTGVEVSPIDIDNVVRGYLGTTGALVLAAADQAINPNRADRPLHQIVGLSAFAYDPVGTRRTSEFYDLREKVVQTHNSLNQMLKTNPERAYAFAEKNAPLLMAYKMVNSTLEELEKTRAMKRYLDTDMAAQSMTGEERLKMKQEIQQYEQNLVEWVREAKNSLGI
jgi:hypothetical protein